MSDEFHARLGNIEGQLQQIQKNTDRIPDFGERLKAAEDDLGDMKPVVKRHDRMLWAGSGVMAVCTAAWAYFLAIVQGGTGQH